jgi:hypothetical protein
MKKKSRLFVLVGALSLVALTGLQGETLCMCGCPNGTVICVESDNGDCSGPCAQVARRCILY